jgi:hypothetical protein
MPDNDPKPLIVEDFLRRRASSLTCYEHPLVLGTDRVGVEIELENLAQLSGYRSRQEMTYWNIETDGSLRNHGIEFITKGDGVGGDVLYRAAEEVESFLQGMNPDPSWRCSTHIHVDVRDLNLDQLKLFVLAYVYFERFIFKESGWKRYKSNFCMPLGLAMDLVPTVSTLFKYENIQEFMLHANQCWPKYTAMNLSVVNTFGTYEFRMPSPTYRTMDLIKTSNRFLALKRVAKEWKGDQISFIEHLSTTDMRSIFQKSVGRDSVFKDEDRAFGFGMARDIIAVAPLKAKSSLLSGEHSSINEIPSRPDFEAPSWSEYEEPDEGDSEPTYDGSSSSSW